MRAASAPLSPASPRDLRLDFFRGLALVCIFIDHIPENYLGYFTLSAIGFFDAAEVFIFISGFTAALVYGRALATRGLLIASDSSNGKLASEDLSRGQTEVTARWAYLR